MKKIGKLGKKKIKITLSCLATSLGEVPEISIQVLLKTPHKRMTKAK